MTHFFSKKTGFKQSRGFSLMEIMIAVLIIASMATVLITNVTAQFNKSKVAQAKILLSQISQALDTFYRDCSFYPESEEGLDALVFPLERCGAWGPEPYLKGGKLPKDPWDNDLIYEYDDTSGAYEIFSLGKDRREGGEGYAADLSSNE